MSGLSTPYLFHAQPRWPLAGNGRQRREPTRLVDAYRREGNEAGLAIWVSD